MAHAINPTAAAHQAHAGESDFTTYLASKLPLVEDALARTAPRIMPEHRADVADDLDRYLYTPLSRFTASGGKRVRPVLALLGAEAVGAPAELALSCGIAIELFQSAALIHDDIADESELRRGEPCLHRTEGTGLAINAGDLALTRVFEVVLVDETLPAERRLRLLEGLARMERYTLEGQALDLGWARDARWDITSDAYLDMVEDKTAWYSAALPLALGALAGGADDEVVHALIEIGRPAGIAFQIQDDLLNLVGDADAQGKDFRSDITEGKRTLAVVTALEHLPEEQRAELVAILEARTTNPDKLGRAVELIEAGGGIAHCRERAEELAHTAIARTEHLARSGAVTTEACQLICSMVHFFIERAS